MELTALDVQQKTFRAALRGYAEEEVDDFLDEVVATLRAHEAQLEEAQSRLAELEQQIAAARETEEAIKRTFIAAQRTSDEMIEEATRRADQVIGEAREESETLVAEGRLKAARMEEDAIRQRSELHDEVELMESVVADLRERFTALAQGSLEQIAPIGKAIDELRDTFGRQTSPEVEDEEPVAAGDWGAPASSFESDESRWSDSEDDQAAFAGRSAFGRARTSRPWERDD